MQAAVNFATDTISMQLDLSRQVESVGSDFESQFEHLFKLHFKALHGYAYTFVQEAVVAEEMVQNVFCKLWEKKDRIVFQQSPKSYLYRAVHNECLNYLRHEQVRKEYVHYSVNTDDKYGHLGIAVEHKELQQHFHRALANLPEQCRTIFQMSRFEELKYREIASELGLSVKTIENQMGKALKILRQELVDFLPSIIIFFSLFIHTK